jgi:hypothetical protein
MVGAGVWDRTHGFGIKGISASPLFRDLVGRLCLLLRIAQMVPKNLDILQKLMVGEPDPDSQKKKKIFAKAFGHYQQLAQTIDMNLGQAHVL